jgi:hypothetical protein
MKKALSILLALIMVLSLSLTLLVSCDNGEENNNNNNNNTNNNNNSNQTNQRVELVFPEEYDFTTSGEKASFHIIQWSVDSNSEPGTDWIPWEEGDVDADDGDLISKVILDRNAMAEETYGVDITAEYVGVNQGFTSKIRSDKMSTSNEYQLLTIRSLDAWELVGEELLANMNEYANKNILHTDMPWWSQDAVASYTLGESLYLCSTEMLLRDKGATTALYFNPSLAADYEGIPDLYALVEDMSWTWEVMLDACEIVSTSLDGDDLMNSVDDMWGVAGSDDDTHMLFNGFGYRYAHIDDDGYLVYDFDTDEDAIVSMIDIHEMYHYADWNTNRIDNQLVGSDSNNQDGVFETDHALFRSASCVKTAVTKLRNMKTDYGILPMPMLDEDQENYSSLVWLHHDSVVGIPSAAANPEMCAVILEFLSWEGCYSVTPVLYETILYGRAAKTAEAKRSLQIIFDTRSYDPGQYWDYAGGMQNELLRLCNKGTSDIQSLIKANIARTYEEIEKVNEFVNKKYDE